ncbi:MAG TPA: hypothetical protein PK883_09905 [Anaerolineaceae bacterium]|nr:hypothetical protein [Anaerolineaceae bacterium]
MALNDYEEDPFDQESFQQDLEPEPVKKPGNRTFLTVLIILGLVFLVGLLGLLLLAPKYIANQRAAQMEQAALINAANTATVMAGFAQESQFLTQQAQTAIALTPTAAPTNTPVVVIATHTPVVASTELSAQELATLSALKTQMAVQGTVVATPTELPDTGFADEFGLPIMGGMAVVLILVIIFSRKLRLSSR